MPSLKPLQGGHSPIEVSCVRDIISFCTVLMSLGTVHKEAIDHHIISYDSYVNDILVLLSQPINKEYMMHKGHSLTIFLTQCIDFTERLSPTLSLGHSPTFVLLTVKKELKDQYITDFCQGLIIFCYLEHQQPKYHVLLQH